MPNTTEIYWKERYINANTGWDIGAPSTPIKTYIDQLEDKTLRILIPGAGNAYEAEYLFNKGFSNVTVLDITSPPLETFIKRVPNFPRTQCIKGDFFNHDGSYDIIIEQTFFCSFPPKPELRHLYAKQMHNLLDTNGKLIGLWFNFPLTGDMEKRPFGGSKEEYLTYFESLFKTHTFDTCYNSIPPRQGKELFGIFKKPGETF